MWEVWMKQGGHWHWVVTGATSPQDALEFVVLDEDVGSIIVCREDDRPVGASAP